MNLVSSKILNENGVKVMPRSISALTSGLFENKENKGSYMGHRKKVIKEKYL